MEVGIRDQAELPVTACRLGAELREARERLGWTLPAIAEHLRIRLPFLEAIEEGRMAELPGNAYALGFVRTYSQALGLDPQEVARRFRAEAAAVNRKTELIFPAPVPERGVPAGAVVLLGAVLAVAAYAGWYRSSGQRPAEVPVRQVPERLAELVVPPAPVVRPAAPVVAEAPPALPPLPAVPPSQAAAAVPSPDLLPPPAPALPDGTRILLRAKADAWVQVRDKAGPVLLNRVLRAGETWPVPPKGQLLLTTGNAGGTEILLDGATAAALGADGVVRRDLPLDPDAIRDGKLAPPGKPAAKPL